MVASSVGAVGGGRGGGGELGGAPFRGGGVFALPPKKPRSPPLRGLRLRGLRLRGLRLLRTLLLGGRTGGADSDDSAGSDLRYASAFPTSPRLCSRACLHSGILRPVVWRRVLMSCTVNNTGRAAGRAALF